MVAQDFVTGLHKQADHCAANGAPGTGAVVRAMIPLGEAGDTQCGRRMANWPRGVIDDAVGLRLAGGIHYLFRAGKAQELRAVYDGTLADQSGIDRLVGALVTENDALLAAWLDSPPQTNEAGRSASFVAALHWLANRTTATFDLFEIGSSAGMNLLIDRYRYDLAGIISGPANCAVTIAPDWRGPPPPATPFAIARVRGCDLNPIAVQSDAAADRLRAYVWPEAAARFARMDAGIAMIRQHGVDLVQADAADWIEARLAEPPVPGQTRVLMHSIVWQYLPPATQARIAAAMDAAGAVATPDAPLAWIALETNRATFRHELRVRYWPGGDTAMRLGDAHAHGAWVEWLDSPQAVVHITP